MPGIPFIKEFKFDYGTAMEVTPLIRRVVAHMQDRFWRQSQLSRRSKKNPRRGLRAAGFVRDRTGAY